MADLTGMMQAAAGAAGGGDNLFIEDVFSCFLYTGNDSTQTITNGIDLDGEGGFVWLKRRNTGAAHMTYDTVRGATNALYTNYDEGNEENLTGLTAFTSAGFSIGSLPTTNSGDDTFVSWTFRKAPKFFDVVTYTGTGANRTVAHNLGSVPGSIWVKRTDTTGDWQVYHRANTANPETDFLVLNSTAATVDSNTRWNDTLPTDTVFTVGTEATVNASGGTYVAYLFAHDDGGFGDDGTENVITCGSYYNSGTAPLNVNLGYEPQWILTKKTDSAQDWYLVDTMRGSSLTAQNILRPNTSAAEGVNEGPPGFAAPTATGFTSYLGATGTFIFIAIRRGPMKTPTAGTEVFSPVTQNVATPSTVTTGFPVDLCINAYRSAVGTTHVMDRLRGGTTTFFNFLQTADAGAESSGTTVGIGFDNNTAVIDNNWISNQSPIYWNFRRAPGYFDEVCYTGTGSAATFAHNLGVVPELMLMKKRSASDDWAVYAGDNTDFLQLNTTAATADDNTYWNDTSPTSTVFSVGTNADVNTSAATYVAYLFASLAGVQDIGTYTGNGTSLTVTTGFQPRFILVKRTDSTGNWIVGDSARGLVAGDDPFSLWNSTAAETTNQDWVDVSATGFTVNETAANACVNTGTYLYWAIS